MGEFLYSKLSEYNLIVLYKLLFKSTHQGLIDLHNHTCYSDGKYTPSEVVKIAYQDNVTTLAITDHNCISGIDEAIRAAKNIEEAFGQNIYIIPGVELSCVWENTRIHLIGIFIDHKSKSILNLIEKIKNGHWSRVEIQIRNLREKGLKINKRIVKNIAKGRVPNWKIMAESLIASGDVQNVSEAREKYLLPGRIGNIPYSDNRWHKVNVTFAIESILKAEGVPLLAHIGDLSHNLGIKKLNKLTDDLINIGLAGFDNSSRKKHKSINKGLNDFITSKSIDPYPGSDFHEARDKRTLYSDYSIIKKLCYKKLNSILLNRPHISNQEINAIHFLPELSILFKENIFIFPKGLLSSLHAQGIVSVYDLNNALTYNLINNNNKDINHTLYITLFYLIIKLQLDTIIHNDCLKIINTANSIKAIKEALCNLEISTTKAESIFFKSVPIAYRLGLEQIAIKLRNDAFIYNYPQLSKFIENEINLILKEILYTTLKTQVAKEIKESFLNQLQKSHLPFIEVQCRVKSIYSILCKISRYWVIGNNQKTKTISVCNSFFDKFRNNYFHFLEQSNNRENISLQELGFGIEDFIGVRIIIHSLKNEEEKMIMYETINSRIIKPLVKNVYHESSKSSKIHHKRKIILGWYQLSNKLLPIEIQVKTLSDYLTGIAFYWYSKGFRIRQDLYPFSSKDMEQKIEIIRKLKNQDDVGAFLMNEIQSK